MTHMLVLIMVLMAVPALILVGLALNSLKTSLNNYSAARETQDHLMNGVSVTHLVAALQVERGTQLVVNCSRFFFIRLASISLRIRLLFIGHVNQFS